MLLKIIKYFLFKNIVYKLYLKIPTKIIFTGTQNFNPLSTDKKPLNLLLKINDDYFSKNKKNQIPTSMHSFDWLNNFKNSGGLNLLQKSRKLILDWDNCEYELNSKIWNEILIARRIINLSTNFEYYGISASDNFKKKITNIINYHFKHLLIINSLQNEKLDIDIEISKSILLICVFFKKKDFFFKTINFIKKQTKHQINQNGFHKSINVVEQARFIHNLIEIKNILLFNNCNKWPDIDLIIKDMTSLLKNLFHKDQSLPLFNATNNKQVDYVRNISNLQKDINIKKLFNISNGIVIVEANKTKLFFDVTKPNSKLLNKKIHSGTLSFEMSCENEKIITNCGSSEKYIGKNQIYFRYSAAHSTTTINNTNISELSEKNGYKRIPKNIKNMSEELANHYVISGSHDGYKDNYGILIKRILKIKKTGNHIYGTDQILITKMKNKNNSFEIRFHLMPESSCVATNNDQQAIIKTKNGMAWYFKSQKNKIRIDDSLYIGNGYQPLASKQIVIYGQVLKIKSIINWELKRVH